MLHAQWKNAFFDRAAVLRAIGPVKKQILSGKGAFIARAAMSSLKSRRDKNIVDKKTGRVTVRSGTPSVPGQPPKVSNLRLPNLKKTVQGTRAILFAYDESTDSVVVGPVLYRSSRSAVPVPRTLEFGGTATTAKHKTIRVQARPYMGPAMIKGIADYDAKQSRPEMI